MHAIRAVGRTAGFHFSRRAAGKRGQVARRKTPNFTRLVIAFRLRQAAQVSAAAAGRGLAVRLALAGVRCPQRC